MQGSQGTSTLKVDPNPVVEGSDITIHCDGSASVEVAVDAGNEQTVPIDTSARSGTFTVPVGARVLWVSVPGDPPTTILVDVLSSKSHDGSSR
jgi:hypothetical protein